MQHIFGALMLLRLLAPQEQQHICTLDCEATHILDAMVIRDGHVKDFTVFFFGCQAMMMKRNSQKQFIERQKKKERHVKIKKQGER